MKKPVFFFVILNLCIILNAQEISPFLIGQNYWIASGDKGNRVGYLNFLWSKVKECGIDPTTSAGKDLILRELTCGGENKLSILKARLTLYY